MMDELISISMHNMMTNQGLSIDEILDFTLSQFDDDNERELVEARMLKIYKEQYEGTPLDKKLNAHYKMNIDTGILKKPEPLTIRSLLKECGVKLEDTNNKTDIE